MRPDWYKIISRLVESGVRYGVSRAYKHTDTPDRDAMADTITAAVMTELCEEIVFDDHSE